MSDVLDRIEESLELAALTTIGLGGVARYFVDVSSSEDLQVALDFADDKDLPVYILGGGSNTIFADEGFDGLVIRVRIGGIEWLEDGRVAVGAGEVWDDFVWQCVERGQAGVECLAGIPGLVGATPMQNVGAYGAQVADVIERVEVLDRETGGVRWLSGEECGFGYRTSRFKTTDAGRFVILRVSFVLQPGGAVNIRYGELSAVVGENAKDLRSVAEAVVGLRAKKSMIIDEHDPHSRSCGSFFTNPVILEDAATVLQADFPEVRMFAVPEGAKVSAAWLVEQAGFAKGYKYKGVGVSENHSLALVNYGGTRAELLELAEMIRAAVQEKFGVWLLIEPVVV